jgi:sec-independent protein translocase protein TatA
MGIGITELLVILAIVALLFGTQKLRGVGGDLGEAIKSFRKAMSDSDSSSASTQTMGEGETKTGQGDEQPKH